MGDVALVAPVIRSVLEQNPNIKIIFLTRKIFLPFFQEHPRLTLEIFDPNIHDGFFGLRKLVKSLLKKHSIDVACDLHDVLRSNILNFWLKTSGVKTFKIEKGRAEKRDMLATKNVKKPLKHTTSRYLDVFNKFKGVETVLTKVKWGGDEEIEGFLSEQNLLNKQSKWIGIAPFAKHKTKVWGIYKIKQLIQYLLEENNNVFLFGGGKDEMNILNEIKNDFPKVILASQKLKLPQELQLMKKLDVLVTMDSSNMHMGALVGTKVVSVWGSTHPSLGFAPLYNEENIVKTTLPLECQPCSVFGNKPCKRGDHICMTSIEVEDVLSKIK